MRTDGNATIDLDLTVPFGCLWRNGVRSACELTVEMRVPDSTNGQCSGTVASHSRYCRTNIQSDQWNKTASILVKYKGTGTYTLGYPNTFIMKLAISTDHEIWDGYELTPIQVVTVINVNVLNLFDLIYKSQRINVYTNISRLIYN